MSGKVMVPAGLCAPHAEAAKAAGRMVTALRKGRPLAEASGAEYVDAATTPGLMVLDRRWSSVSATAPQLHVDLVWRKLWDKCMKDDTHDVFDRAAREALEAPWSFVGLAGQQLYSVVRRAEAQLRFLDAARAHWAALTSLGPRFSHGAAGGTRLERLPTLVNYCLARQGADVDFARHPLTADALAQALDALPGYKVRAHLQRGEVAEAAAQLRGRGDITIVSLAEHFLAAGEEAAACAAVEEHMGADPYNITRDWLSARGDLTRTVR